MTADLSLRLHRHEERLTISDLRRRLSATKDPLARVRVRIELVHVYRQICLMKNARFELMEAFRDLSLHYPSNTLRTIVPLLGDVVRLWRNRKTISREELAVRTALFEEAGLSAYYLRDFFSMFYCVAGAFLPAFLSRPSPAWAAWTGASGCAFALVKMAWAVKHLITALDKTVGALDTREDWSRSHLWKGLAHEYLGNPSLAEDHFRKSIAHSTSADQRLLVFTLCCNYNLRGLAKEIVDSPWKGSGVFLAGDALEWCALPSLAWLRKDKERSDIIARSRAIFCANNAESWLIAQYAGNVLLSSYLSGDWDETEVNDCVNRVKMMGLRPWKIHVEASHVLVGEAYIETVRALREGDPPLSRKQCRAAVRRLSLSFPHPSLKLHEILIRAIDASVRRHSRLLSRWLDRGDLLARSTGNDWARFEILRLRSLDKTPEEAARLLSQAETLSQSKGWKRHPPAFSLIQQAL